MKQILSLQLVRITTDDIIGAQENTGIANMSGVQHIHFPKWVFNEKYGNVLGSDYYMQFVNRHSDKKTYLCFDITYMDPILDFEQSQNGDFSAFDFCQKDGELYEICKNLDPISYQEYLQGLIGIKHFLVDVKYEREGEGDEVEAIVTIIKYINLDNIL